MAEKTYLQAIPDGLRQEMRRDKRVFVIGEDVGVYGGAFKVTQGFQEEFGPWRVIDAPLAETAIVGGCTGAAIMGMRPVAEMQFADFISCAWDHLVTVAAKQRYRSWLRENADFTDEEEDELRADVKKALNEAIKRAEESPLPDPSSLLEGVFATPEDLDTPHHK